MKKLNKEQLEAVIDSFREYLNNGDVIFRDALKEKGLIEEEFEAGKWYKHCSGGFWFIQKSIENGQHIVYGFDADMEWIEEWEVFLNSSVLTKATDSEVSTALITEAKKRGFKEGVRVEGYNYVVSGDFFYQKNHKSLYMGKVSPDRSTWSRCGMSSSTSRTPWRR